MLLRRRLICTRLCDVDVEVPERCAPLLGRLESWGRCVIAVVYSGFLYKTCVQHCCLENASIQYFQRTHPMVAHI